jgi:[protein-PII] uridylyltransferase
VRAYSRAEFEAERRTIEKAFLDGTSVHTTLQALCELAERTIQENLQAAFQAHNLETTGLAVLAIGGFGRRILFPYSDLDILLLFENVRAEQKLEPAVAEFTRTLWDRGFRVSSAARTLDESKRVDRDNVEFHLSMMDRRFLLGDDTVHQKLEQKVLPRTEKVYRSFLHEELTRLTKQRLAKYGNTIFHLEPNVKDSPGGLRDFHATTWMRQVGAGASEIRGADVVERDLALNAVDFISQVRCFLHYQNGRNDNTLTYELQTVAAEKSLGARDGVERNAAEWMRIYYRHARTLNQQLQRSLSLQSITAHSLWQKLLLAGRPPKLELTPGKPYAIRNGQFDILDSTAFSDRTAVMSLLTEAAQTGLEMCRHAERKMAYILFHSELPAKNQEISWNQLQQILGSDFPGVALRPMQRLGLLTEVLPEFALIDSLVIRDFYHRYTVDEHSLRTIEHLQALAEPSDARDVPFSALWKTVERRDLLVLSLLLHDVGKGMPVENHVSGSLGGLETAAQRLHLSPGDEAEVHFLIEQHLEMSATMQRRDVFDPVTVRSFAAVVETRERLQRLCLLTYADIHAVNPEALTPWRAEMLLQLYLATSNLLTHSLDSNRLHAPAEETLLEQLRALTGCEDSGKIERFLEGFPRRYSHVHSPAEIANHFALGQRLSIEPVQIELISAPHALSLTLLTADRPGLFATIAGVLTSWGMNIVKAEAFANNAGMVLDSFHFTDSSRTFELNPSEIDRFRRNLTEVLLGTTALQSPLRTTGTISTPKIPKVNVETSIKFDDSSSEHCTLLEIVTQDKRGLLYLLSSTMARLDCNIEVALIDTEGQKAIDVFYMTKKGWKLSASDQTTLLDALQTVLT